MKKLISILSLIVALQAHAQIISRFTWAGTSPTTAAQGPNGISVSASATTSNVGGSIGWALNPGLPTANVDLILPGSPYFDVNNIDISLYFRREESVASFFKRGANFDFGSSSGFLTVKFTTTRGSTPGDTTISSGNIVAIANDHTFHNYRFRYDNNTGVAKVLVDGVVVYTYNGVAGRPLSWTSAGNVIIGENMDATSTNIPVLANMTVQMYNAVLPLNIISFNAVGINKQSKLTWKFSEEANAARYAVERSGDNVHFAEISSTNVAMAGEYTFVDNNPLNGINYYRLRVVDKLGYSTFSGIRQLRFENITPGITFYPNPAVNFITINIPSNDAYDYALINLHGVTVKTGTLQGSQQSRIDIDKSIVAGTYVMRLLNRTSNQLKSLVIVKQK